MANFNNELNALIKAKVVKLKVELDVQGSIKHIRGQVDEITRLLDSKSVKLNVELKTSMADLNKQIRALSARINASKTFEPLKIGIQIDVQGSARYIKKQLEDINRVITDFNSKYGKQLKDMQDKVDRVNKKTAQVTNKVPTTAGAINFNNIKQYTKALEDAERIMKSKMKTNEKGIFSTHEFKDAEGNLQGFIATLQKSNGIIEKAKYTWNEAKQAFTLIDRTTTTQTEKEVQKAVNSLKTLERELKSTGDAQERFAEEYKRLMSMGSKGTLDSGIVNDFRNRIKDAQTELDIAKKQNALLKEEADLRRKLSEYRKSISKNYRASGNLDDISRDLRKLSIGDGYNASNANEVAKLKERFETEKRFIDEISKKKKQQIDIDKKRLDMINNIQKIERTVDLTNKSGPLSRRYLEETNHLVKKMKTMEDYIVVKRRMDAVDRSVTQVKIDTQIENEMQRLKKSLYDYVEVQGKSLSTAEKRFDQLRKNIGNNLGQIQSKINEYTNKTKDIKLNNDAMQKANSIVKNIDHNAFGQLIKNKDIESVRGFVSELNKANVAIMSLDEKKGITRIKAQLESTGKTAKEVAYEFNRLTGQLSQVGTKDVFNRNANLGIFEQLRIAMARVPVWMVATTAFYGTIRAIGNMKNEIMEVDKALTELNRVAEANTNIEALFEGSVDMAKELGNNIHDIMDTMNEFARTFGSFSDRQLLDITKTATLMANVSDLTAQEAGTTLVTTMNAFNIAASESIQIVDKLNEVDNNYAVSTKQLAEGLQKSASTAKTFGVTMEENIGHITAISSVTGESGKVIGREIADVKSLLIDLEILLF